MAAADWVAATEHYAQLGLTGTAGEPLKPRNVRKVWERVVRGYGCAIAKSTPPAMSMPPAQAAVPSPSLPTFAAEPVAFEFRTLRRTPIRKQE